MNEKKKEIEQFDSIYEKYKILKIIKQYSI